MLRSKSLKQRIVKDMLENKDEFVDFVHKSRYNVYLTSSIESDSDILDAVLSIIKSYGYDEMKGIIYKLEKDNKKYYALVCGQEGYDYSEEGNSFKVAEWEGIFCSICEAINGKDMKESDLQELGLE